MSLRASKIQKLQTKDHSNISIHISKNKQLTTQLNKRLMEILAGVTALISCFFFHSKGLA